MIHCEVTQPTDVQSMVTGNTGVHQDAVLAALVFDAYRFICTVKLLTQRSDQQQTCSTELCLIASAAKLCTPEELQLCRLCRGFD